MTSENFTITGSLSTSKGTATYKGLTLTQCLKMESSTNVEFTTTKESTLTLVFSTTDNKRNIKVDNVKHTFESNIFTLELPAGKHTITKADTTNLFYIEVAYEGETDPVDPTDPPDPVDPVDPPEPGDIGDLVSAGTATNIFGKEDSYFANAIYVAPNGTPEGQGSEENPLDLVSAIKAVKSVNGSAILLMEGTYSFDSQINIDFENNGTAESYKVLKASKGAEVVLDFSSQEYSMKDTSLNARGIQLDGSYWYVEGITIFGAADNGMMISGSHNIIENCVFDSNKDTGLQISRRNSTLTNYEDWPAYNHIINSTSKNNCDPATYENADGFAAKLTCGDGNVFDGCIAYNNSDDGWDLFAKTETGPIGVVTIKNSIAMRNGKTESGLTKPSCDGNGFKLGGSGVGTPHIVINSLAIENLYHGFTDNNNPTAIGLKNVTAFDNNQGGGKNNFSVNRCKDAYVANAVSYTTNGTSDKYVNLSAEYTILYNSNKWYKVEKLQVMDTGKSATRGTVLSKGITMADFISTGVPAVGTDFHKVWRNADGTINTKGVGIISPASDYATFSTDGGVIGARFSSDNKTTVTQVNVDSGETEIPTESVEKPNASVVSGTYSTPQYVELTTTTEGAAIYYTINGEEPTVLSARYEDALVISKTTTVKAIAVKNGMNDSGVAVFEYRINNPSVIDVIVSPSKISMKKGSSQQFTAELVVENDADQTVIWTVLGGNDSTITPNGLLEIGIEEKAVSLTVTATSAFDNTKKGIAEIIVTEFPVTYYTVTASAGAGGTISPTGDVNVMKGNDKTFTVTPNSGYYISDVIVDMKSIGAKNQYTFSNVIQNHTIKAVFGKYKDDDGSSDDSSSDGDNGNTETKPPTTPTQEFISAEKISKNVETALANGKTPSISVPKNGVIFEISKETVTQLKNSKGGFIIQDINTQIGLENDVFNQLSGTRLSGSVSNLSTELYDRVKTLVAKEDSTTLIGDAKLTTELIIKSDGKIVEKFAEPLVIEIDLSDQLKKIKDTSKLTLARVTEINGKLEITKIGGEYDSHTKTFKAYSDQVGKFILLECDNIKKINLVIDSKISTINGVAKVNDIAPVIINDRTMMPLRFITENLGGTVKWNGKTQEITLYINETELKIQVGTIIDGYNVSPLIQNGRTLVPLRYISEAIGANVTWIPSTKSIQIVK